MKSVQLTLESKTMLGFAVLLITVVVMALLNKLSPEFVDLIKWVGGSFFAVRGVANAFENLGANRGSSSKTDR